MADLDKNRDLNQGNEAHEPDANRDPLSGQPGAHPVGTGIGAAGIGTVGAVVGGVIGGPVGAVIGSAVGAVAGGLVGKSAAEAVDPTVEDEYWRNNYASRPYVEPGRTYDDYQSAYRTGYEGYGRHAETGRKFNEVEPHLRSDYETRHGGTGLAWDKAKHAARDAWDKVENTVTGSSDRNSEQNLASRGDTQQVNLYEERLIADKTRVKTGEVNVSKHVETETARVSVPVEKERVVVERTTPTNAGTPVTPGEANFQEGEVARVEIYEERADIHKEAVLREEVNIKKEVDHETVQAEEQIRREELDIDRQGREVSDRSNPLT